jgi:hypothetical protein
VIALAVVAALAFMFSAAPAQASAGDESPLALTTKVVSGQKFKAGDTVKIRLTAKNTSKKTIEMPAQSGLLVSFAREYLGEQETLTGGFVLDGFGEDDTYAYWDYYKALPGRVKAGESFSTTITYKAVAQDVANGGVFATLSYVNDTTSYEDLSFVFATVPASGKSDPTVRGTSKVGKLLTVAPGYTGVWNHNYEYQWLRNGKAIKGATKSTYKLKAADAGKKISVLIAGEDRAGFNGWAVFEANVAKKIAALTLKAPTPRVTGTTKVGKTLKATTSGWTKNTKKSYQWYANGKKIKGATKSSLKLTKAHAGKRITVKVTGKKAGYKTVVKTSKKTVTIKR